MRSSMILDNHDDERKKERKKEKSLNREENRPLYEIVRGCRFLSAYSEIIKPLRTLRKGNPKLAHPVTHANYLSMYLIKELAIYESAI